jgi:hypothetical protein
MKLFRLEYLVFLAAAAILSWNLWNIGIASGYIDPILHFGAQDEATYTREAIAIVRDGGWMTPTFLGRWVFEKPPLLMWFSALSMKAFGINPLAARLPVIFSGALVCALCFAIVRRQRSVLAALTAAAMALSSQILFIMSRHAMTDILLAAAGMCAFAILFRDPDLLKTTSFAAFVLAAAAGIVAKSIAGILVVIVMAVVVGLGRRRYARASLAAVFAILLASPWFLFNYFVHRDWFLADMGYQIITVGSAGHQNSQENHLWFYVIRILNSDLLPLILALTAIPTVARAVRRREPASLLTAAYCLIYIAAILVFRFSSEQYLCWLIPALILVAALYSPLLNGKLAPVALAIVAAAFVSKFANPDSDFGISIGPGTTVAAAPPLSRYCQEHRATDLYLLGVNDEFYSAALPLHRVHYAWIDSTDIVAREHPHLAFLGILIPAADLSQLSRNLPIYRDRLRAWGLDSTQPIATGITAHDAASLQQIIHEHPEADFLVSQTILPDPQKLDTHRTVFSNGDFALLESKLPTAPEPPAWSCQM